MVKKCLAITIMLIAGGAWIFLECLNKQEQGNATQARLEIEKARSEAQKRASSKLSFESKILTDLNICKAAAEKGKKEYVSLIPRVVINKRGPYVNSQLLEAEALKILEEAQLECQQLYDVRLKAGQ